MIIVDNISKIFNIPHEKTRTLYHKLFFFSSRGYTYERLYALKNVSLRVNPGECLGIIGKNGSGKSTLLRIIAGIYRPSSGNISVNEDISPLLELGLGFDTTFSCKDNIFVYGALLGFSREQMTSRIDEILAFAELERFADAKLDTLSSGMKMRLAFSIAIQSVAPIILVDEVLAVGDKVFSEKCSNVFRRFRDEGRTVVLVSHNMPSIREFCDRVLILHNGLLVAEGAPDDMIKMYNDKIVPTPADQDPSIATRPSTISTSGKSLKAGQVPTPYDPREFWEKRLRQNFNLVGVGNIMFDEKYNEYLYRQREQVLSRVLKKQQIRVEGKTVLDVGCGTGYFVKYYLERNAKVTGLDVAPIVIDRLAKTLPGARYHALDVANGHFKIEGHYDIVHLFSTAFHITDDDGFRTAMRHLSKVLKTGGYMFITDNFPEKTLAPAPHVKFRSMSDYRVLEENRLKIIDRINIHYFLNRKFRKISYARHRYLAFVLAMMDSIMRGLRLTNHDNLKLLVLRKEGKG